MKKYKGINTKLAHLGNKPDEYHGFINPPVVRASTVLFPNANAMETREQKYTYGTHGTPTTDALCEIITELENAKGCVLMPSGLASITVPLMVFAEKGGHILVVDSLYAPTRKFCDGILKNMGIEIEYFSAHIGDEFEKLMKPNTCIVMLECPASNSFEMIDVEAIAGMVHKSNSECVVMMDNTWATPVFFKPLDYGVDVSIQALTKYAGGHSDVLMGSAAANEKWFTKLHEGHDQMGICVGGDDAYLVMRGLRTMGIRLERQQKSTMEICLWLQKHKKVERVLYPALPEDPGYDIWKKLYKGATGLFSFVLKEATHQQAKQFVDALEIHGLGYSWAGYESLAVVPKFDDRVHNLAPKGGATVRIQVGLEDVEDIIEDLEKGFDAIG